MPGAVEDADALGLVAVPGEQFFDVDVGAGGAAGVSGDDDGVLSGGEAAEVVEERADGLAGRGHGDGRARGGLSRLWL